MNEKVHFRRSPPPHTSKQCCLCVQRKLDIIKRVGGLFIQIVFSHVANLLTNILARIVFGMNFWQMNVRDMWKVYMIKLSHANFQNWPDRKNLAEFLLTEFDFENSYLKSMQWTIWMKLHENDGNHNPMLIKLDKNKRWRCVKRKLLEN